MSKNSMTEEQYLEGIKYAEENFQDENADHLKVDKKLIREKFDLTGKRILDFGCGMGGMTLWYATNWDCFVHGLDIDGHHITIAEALQEKHQVSNVLFEKRNILDAPLEKKYDMVFLNDVAEHIQINILKDIFEELKNSLSEEGRIFVTYPPWKSPYASHVTHAVKIPWCQFLPKKTLMRLIEKNNHTIVGDLESDLVHAYEGLNHLTHKKMMEVCKEVGLKPIYRKSHSILNRISPLKNINFNVFPFDYIVTKEFLLLEVA